MAPNLTPTAPRDVIQGYGQGSERFIDLRAIGSSGLRQFSGFVYESTLRELEGRRAVEAFKEMGDNDAISGAILYTIDKLIRQVPWQVNSASTADFDVEAAEFLESCIHDMNSHTWTDFISEALGGMLRYGFSLHEVVYKRRAGDAPQEHMRSKYADGRIGWRAIAGRAQDTIYRWLFAENGSLIGAEQQAPPHYNIIKLPLEKCLLFRTTAERDNPEGRSIFRSSYRSYVIKRGIEALEASGVEKDITGTPIAWIPRELLEAAEEGDSHAAAMVEMFKRLATDLRQDSRAGVVFPLEYDENNNKRFDLTLLPSPGTKLFDTDKIIQRLDQRQAMGALADFLLLGQGATAQGSWAMHSDKTKMFMQALKAFLQIFCETLNNHAVPRLFRYNTLKVSDYPRIDVGDLDAVDLSALGDLVLKLSQAGMPLFPDDNLEKYIREAAGWPEASHDLSEVSDVLPQPMEDNADAMPEVLDGTEDGQIGQMAPLTGDVYTNAKPVNDAPQTNVSGQGRPVVVT